jgi:hypothetical protein
MATGKKVQGESVDSAREYAARIRSLIEGERLDEARALLGQALEANPHDGELLGLEEVLRPPRARPCQVADDDRSREFEWIRANAHFYRGRWVAIQGDRLLADAGSFAELQSRIKDLEKAPLVHRIH